MQIGKIVGTVVSTRKDEKLEGFRFHVVQYTDVDGNPSGGIVVAVDAVGAGVGELVLVAAGSSARQTRATEGMPLDAIIMAIIDIVEINGEHRYVKNPLRRRVSPASRSRSLSTLMLVPEIGCC